jgi:mannitol/fructose-specific phosphotransferase system IIA component (Ntr-type)
MRPSSTGCPALSELLTPEAINLNLTGRERDETLAELVAQIKEIAGRPAARHTLLRALQRREQLQTANLANGVAIPNARNALVGLVDQPTVVFGRHDEGVVFGAPDDAPARLFFLFVAPSVSQHLALVSRANRLLRLPRLRQGLLDAAGPEDVIGVIRDAESDL